MWICAAASGESRHHRAMQRGNAPRAEAFLNP
jgi:hypothetical protein